MVSRDSPVWEGDLDFRRFHCCGDEDLFPFKCAACWLPLVFCYECDTLYPGTATSTISTASGRSSTARAGPRSGRPSLRRDAP